MSPDTISDPSSGASMDSNVALEIASLTIESVEGCENVIDECLSICIGQDLFVGRDEEQCLLSFNSVYVSRLHFRIYSIDLDEEIPTCPPLVYCEDRMSANGTYVNDTLIGMHKCPKNPHLLSDGDIITIRPYWKFRFNQSLPIRARTFNDIQTQEMKIFDELYKVSNRVLGSGQYGMVYAASDLTTQHQVACKIVSLEETSVALMDPKSAQQQLESAREMRRKVFKEVEILTKLTHPNILSVYKAYHSDRNLYIFSELAPGGDLLAFIAANGYFLDDLSACTVCHQLSMAVEFLHSNGIAHRDLKPENILVMRNLSGSRVVLSDFGAATYFSTGSKISRMMSLVGTADYLAPEFHHRLAQGYTEATDLWSLGVVAVCTLSGAKMFPFKELQSLNQADIRTKLTMNDQPPSCQAAWKTTSYSARDFVEKLLVLDSAKRMTATQAVEHDWFQKPKGRENELKGLHKRTSMTWNRRPTNFNLIEPIPEITTKSKTRAKKKLPDATNSPYFNLERHLYANTISSYEVRKSRQRILRNVRESGSLFVTNKSKDFSGTNFALRSNSRRKRSPTRTGLSRPLKIQTSNAHWPTDSDSIEKLRVPHQNGINKRQSKQRMVHIRTLAPPASFEVMSIPEVNPNDLFGTIPVDFRATQDAENKKIQFSQPERAGFGSIGDDLDSANHPFQEYDLQDMDSPTVTFLRSHPGTTTKTAHSVTERENVTAQSPGGLVALGHLFATESDISQLLECSQIRDANIYTPTAEEEQLAAMAYHCVGTKPCANNANRQSLERDPFAK